MTDFTKVAVRENGGVLGLSINDLGADDLELNIDKEKEKELLLSKVKDIYDTADTKYQSHKEVFPPQIVNHNGELYIQYFLGVNYSNKTSENMSDFIKQILIPVRLLTVSTTNH